MAFTQIATGIYSIYNIGKIGSGIKLAKSDIPNNRISYSLDGGYTWDAYSNAFLRGGEYGLRIRSRDGNKIFVSDDVGAPSVGKLWRSIDGGINFTDVLTVDSYNPPTQTGDALDIIEIDENNVIVGYHGGWLFIYRSINGGASFEPAQWVRIPTGNQSSEGRTTETHTRSAFSKNSLNVVLLGTHSRNTDSNPGWSKNIFRSSDLGASWVHVLNMTPWYFNATGYTIALSFITDDIAIAFQEDDLGNVKCWRSTDAGLTWQDIGIVHSGQIRRVTALLALGSKVLMATQNAALNSVAIYQSTDLGLTWSPYSNYGSLPTGSGIAITSLLLLGDNSIIFHANNGTIWKDVTFAPDPPINVIATAGDQKNIITWTGV